MEAVAGLKTLQIISPPTHILETRIKSGPAWNLPKGIQRSFHSGVRKNPMLVFTTRLKSRSSDLVEAFRA